jgi:hypothetical protein
MKVLKIKRLSNYGLFESVDCHLLTQQRLNLSLLLVDFKSGLNRVKAVVFSLDGSCEDCVEQATTV